MQKFIDNLKRQAEANPVVALGAGAVFIQAMSKLLNANTSRANAKTWKKEVDRRSKGSRK